MQNLSLTLIINDHTGRKEFHVKTHRKLTPEEEQSVISKKSLWNSIGHKTLFGATYEIIEVIAADGWEEAE